MFRALSPFLALLGRPTRPWIFAAGAFLLSQALGVRAAQASCGDWLDHRALRGEHATSAEFPVTSDDVAHRLPAEGPCRGPSCQRAPQPTAPAAPHRVVAPPREQVCTL